MRLWLVVLMIALLPLRGWLGDAMAAEAMAQHMGRPASAVQTAEPAPHDTANAAASAASDAALAAVHAECSGHAAGATAAEPGLSMADAAAPLDCGTCLSCQVCHSVLLGAAEPPSVGTLALPQGAAPSVTAFASAELFRDAKPPIS